MTALYEASVKICTYSTVQVEAGDIHHAREKAHDLSECKEIYDDRTEVEQVGKITKVRD